MADFFDYFRQLEKHQIRLNDLDRVLRNCQLLTAEQAAQVMQHVFWVVTGSRDLPDAVGDEGDEWASS
jgi:hypothetical protein